MFLRTITTVQNAIIAEQEHRPMNNRDKLNDKKPLEMERKKTILKIQ